MAIFNSKLKIRYLVTYLTLVVGISLALSWFLWSSYTVSIHEAENTTNNLVKLLDSHFTQVLSRVDAILETQAREISPDQLMRSAVAKNKAAMSAHMARLITAFPDTAGTFYFDENGELLYSSNVHVKQFNIRDREHFKIARRQITNELVFSEAEVARSTGNWALVVQRGIRSSEGKFLGVTSLIIDLSQEEKILESLNIGPNSILVIRRSDNGKLVLRIPFTEKEINKTIPQNNEIRQKVIAGINGGTVINQSPIDKIERVISYQKITGFPFYVQIGVDKQEYLIAWYKELYWSVGLASFFFVVLGAGLARILRLERHEVEERERLHAMLSTASDGIHILDEQGNVVQFSDSFAKMLGYSPEETIKLNVIDWDAKIPKDQLPAFVRQLIGNSETFETKHVCKDGTLLDVEISAKGIELSGKPYLYASSRDITSRKQLDEKLHASEQRLRSLYELSPLGIALVDMSGKYIDFNKSFLEITGYTGEELQRLDYWALTPPKYSEAETEQLKLLVETGRYGPYEKEYIHKSGRLVPIQLNGMLVKGMTGEEHIWSIVEDISERRKAEEMLRSASLYARNLIESSIDPLVTISAKGKIMDVNQATEKVTGCARGELVGTDFSDYFTEPDKAREGYQKVFADGFVTDYPLAIRHKSGNVTEVIYNASVYRDEQGQVQGVFASVRDFTEQRKAQKAISEARESAERTAKIRSEFLANMSHEIRTPMNGIIGLTQLALNQPTSPEVRDYLSKISTSSMSLLSILNDILDLSKLEAGRMEIENAPFDLDRTTDNLRNMFEERAHAKRLGFSIEVAEHTPRDLIGDSLRLQQVLSNLIGNAFKFTEHGQVAIKISPKQITPTQAQITFTVEDSGIGIAKENLDKLFKPFSQVDASTSRKFGGTGLGLSISQRLLELMGGEFSVSSQPEKGTSISFDLQLGIVNSIVPRETRQRVKHEAGELTHKLGDAAKTLKGARILVAEDNSINQQVVREFLKLSGMEVVIANNGQEALDALHLQDFDAVLMDVHMPVMDGIEATRRIREQEKFYHLPVLALTADVVQEEREKCIASGMNDFISKPINPEALIAALSRWVKNEPSLPS